MAIYMTYKFHLYLLLQNHFSILLLLVFLYIWMMMMMMMMMLYFTQVNYWLRYGEDENQAIQATLAGQREQALVIGLLPDTWYYVSVQVFNDAGNGQKSEKYPQETFRRGQEKGNKKKTFLLWQIMFYFLRLELVCQVSFYDKQCNNLEIRIFSSYLLQIMIINSFLCKRNFNIFCFSTPHVPHSGQGSLLQFWLGQGHFPWCGHHSRGRTTPGIQGKIQHQVKDLCPRN